MGLCPFPARPRLCGERETASALANAHISSYRALLTVPSKDNGNVPIGGPKYGVTIRVTRRTVIM